MTMLKWPAHARAALIQLAKGLAWVLPGAVLALMPKCPLCFAAVAALWTGIGLSLTAATGLRIALIIVSVGALTFLAIRKIRRPGLRVACLLRQCDRAGTPPITGTAETPESAGNKPSGALSR